MIPKHSTCLWMAINNGLKTRDLLSNKIQVPDPTCTFYWSKQHLLVDCLHSNQIWSSILSMFKALNRAGSLVDQMQLLPSFCDESRKGNLTIAKLYCPSFMCHMWRERTSRIFYNKPLPWQHTLHSVFASGSEKSYLPLPSIVSWLWSSLEYTVVLSSHSSLCPYCYLGWCCLLGYPLQHSTR